LEDLENALQRKTTVLAEFSGYGIAGEAYHMTAPEPTAASEARVMRAAMDEGSISPSEVDYINAHGTGTPLNDKMETLAIKQALGERSYQVPVSSIKSMVGHCLGSAGAVEAVACVLSIRHGFVPPTVNHQKGDVDCDLDYVPGHAHEMDVNVVLSNSFAFGGNCTTLGFKKYLALKKI
jgi:3-oxoacyl-[acyl-carrier-protein] synthase II